MGKRIAINVVQHYTLETPKFVETEFGDTGTWIWHVVGIVTENPVEDIYDEEIGQVECDPEIENVGAFTVRKSAWQRREKSHCSLFDDFDVEFPELCGLIPGWSVDEEQEHIICDDGWKVDVSEITDREMQWEDVYVIDGVRLFEKYAENLDYLVEGIATYINAYCSEESFVLMPVEGDFKNSKVQQAFEKLGFHNVEDTILLKDCSEDDTYEFPEN